MLVLPDLFSAQLVLYPEATVQDLYKALFQAIMGPEHAVMDREAARRYLEEEYDSVKPSEKLLLEPLGLGHYRLHLGAAKHRKIPSLAILNAFVDSAQYKGDRTTLHYYLLQWLSLDSNPSVQSYILSRLESGLGAVHHSESFRQLYKPAYRVVHEKFVLPHWLNN